MSTTTALASSIATRMLTSPRRRPAGSFGSKGALIGPSPLQEVGPRADTCGSLSSTRDSSLLGVASQDPRPLLTSGGLTLSGALRDGRTHLTEPTCNNQHETARAVLSRACRMATAHL